jgi:hypothetical protein
MYLTLYKRAFPKCINSKFFPLATHLLLVILPSVDCKLDNADLAHKLTEQTWPMNCRIGSGLY